MRALEIWCQRVTSSYSNVDVTDLSSSFRDGLAFCAIIHHFRPELIDYDSLKSDQMLKNNELAFTIAEEKLGIPSLLDPEDMVDSEVPDKFSVATYLAQFYHMFKNDDDSRTSSPKPRLLRGSESSETNSSTEGTPLGTPTLVTKSRIFNPKDLIEKYGEDIFSKSNSSSGVSESGLRKTPNGSSPSVASVCKEFELKARVSTQEKQQS